MTIQKNTPKCRFIGFTNEWEKVRLDNCCVVNPKSSEIPSEFFYIDLESVEKGQLLELKTVNKKNAPSRAQRLLSKGDILFQTVRPYQKNNYLFEVENHLSTVASTGYAQLRTNEDNKFLYYLLHTRKFNNDVMIRCTGSNYPAISSTDLLEINLYIPSLEEQKKIGGFFSILDERIEAQKAKIDKLKDTKQAYLNEMFPQEGQSKPKRRFKGFTDEWEEKKLGEIVTNKGGTSLEKFTNDNGTHRFISIGNYSMDGKYIDSGQRININEKTKDKLLNKNDLVMVLNDKTSSGDIIGSTILIDEDDKYIYNQRSERIICNTVVSPLFCWVLLNTNEFRKRVFKVSQGGTQIYVTFTTVKELKVMLPSLEEQQKIGEFFFILDERIDVESEKLKKLEDLKQAYLNELFV